MTESPSVLDPTSSSDNSLEQASARPTAPQVFRVSPLIRMTLLTLYVALTLPLPV
jgi:hypothetical protein